MRRKIILITAREEKPARVSVSVQAEFSDINRCIYCERIDYKESWRDKADKLYEKAVSLFAQGKARFKPAYCPACFEEHYIKKDIKSLRSEDLSAEERAEFMREKI